MSARIKIDRTPFAAVAADLRNADEVIITAQYRALNKVANKTLTRARREIASAVNLKSTYVKERTGVRPASKGKLEAVIYGRSRATRLATYSAKQIVKAAKRANGDRLRGIPAGRKQAGVSVHVGDGRKKMPGAFLIPLRAGKQDGGNGFGVFIRTGSARNTKSIIQAGPVSESRGTRRGIETRAGDIRHLYGPSVDQVFGWISPKLDEGVQRDLDETVAKQLDYEIRKALKVK